MTLRTLDDLDIAGKRVLIRADLNVPLRDCKVGDRSRIAASAQTIREVLDKGGRPVVVSHLGRPKGKRDDSLSLKPVAGPLGEAIGGAEVRFAADCIGEEARSAVEDLPEGQVALLENLRFHAGETKNDADFAAALAELGDVYVDDAFSAAHRAHASIVALAERLPAAAGRLMQQELESLERLLAKPAEPYFALLGGAKVETKLGVAETLLRKGADVALAGGLANTVLQTQGVAIGRSICDRDLAEMAGRLPELAQNQRRALLLPVDAVIAPDARHPDQAQTVAIGEVPDDQMILDVGPRSADAFIEQIEAARTVVWNGPLGAAEQEAFAGATLKVARAIAERTQAGDLTSVVGGGDTVAVLQEAGLLDRFTYASMAGGAFLAWLEGETLPGVAVLAGGERPRAVAR